MARLKTMVAALAAAGLTFAQPAAAAARAGAPIGETETLTEGPGGTFVIGLLGLIGVIFVIMAISQSSDPTDALPTSP